MNVHCKYFVMRVGKNWELTMTTGKSIKPSNAISSMLMQGIVLIRWECFSEFHDFPHRIYQIVLGQDLY